MRTTKRDTYPLNSLKLKDLLMLCDAYSREKQHWLNVLQSWQYQAMLGSSRAIRDIFVREKYQSPYGLQARHWKLALQDAIDAWDAYWQSLFVTVRAKIFHYTNDEEERHYGYWLLSGYAQFAALMQGKHPQAPFPIEKEACRRMAHFIKRTVRKYKKRPPRVQKSRIATFDADCYTVFEKNGHQFLKLMSLERGKRIIIPLKGIKKIRGNITIVAKKGSFTVHQTEEVHPSKKRKEGIIESIDLGYTEVCTDTDGNHYGTNFGKLLTKASDARDQKMKKRNCLHAIEKKHRTRNPRKAKRIRKNNLGRKKLFTTKVRSQASLECEVNRALNTLITKRDFFILVTEDLRHTFSFHGPKTRNRRFSSWIKGKLQDRIAFKALAEGFRHEQVNPAYGSQTCPICDFVDEKNRIFDSFQCLYCRHVDHADRVAAVNYLRRYGDPEIGRYTPYRQVKPILLQRFNRRLEAASAATVPGKTLDTVQNGSPLHFVEKNKAGSVGLRVNRAVPRRANQNEYV